MTKSPYLSNEGRLADVVAAIQAMGTYKFYKLDFEVWADRITANPKQAYYWKNVFEQHPEFFRLDSERKKASLVWRRQYPKRYHVDLEKRLSTDEVDKLSEDQKKRVSRDPLNAEDIKALVDTAINLHSRALESERERKWWIPLVSGVGALVGAILGAFLRGKS